MIPQSNSRKCKISKRECLSFGTGELISCSFSTNSSYHVARTFATVKGMVFTITSHFPRLGLCNAFDAKLISDYPEEHEWLIGFCYARILKFETRDIKQFMGSYAELADYPMASLAKEIFFAVHLFKEQIFSMSDQVEMYLYDFLMVNRRECCSNEAQKRYRTDLTKNK